MSSAPVKPQVQPVPGSEDHLAAEFARRHRGTVFRAESAWQVHNPDGSISTLSSDVRVQNSLRLLARALASSVPEHARIRFCSWEFISAVIAWLKIDPALVATDEELTALLWRRARRLTLLTGLDRVIEDQFHPLPPEILASVEAERELQTADKPDF